MAVQFHPLPKHIFSDEQQPYFERLNRELRDLFALEGLIKEPRQSKRSDDSVSRRGEVQVHTSRITPSIDTIISGASTVVGTPALTLGQTNTVGSTTTALSINSAIALFDTTAPEAVSTSSSVGTAAFAARRDHTHDGSALLPRDGTRDMTGELGTDVGTFRSDVASGGVGFLFNTSNSFASGTVFRVSDNGSAMFEQNFEGHASIIGSESAANSQDILRIFKTISADNRLAFRGLNVIPTIEGNIAGAVYSPTHAGVVCTITLQPTQVGSIGNRTIRGGDFAAALGNSAGQGSGTMLATGGRFIVSDIGLATPWQTAVAGDFSITGSFASGLTNSYGARINSIPVGTNRWGVWASNKIHCDASDFIANTNAKGLITKDSQGTARFWRTHVDAASGTTGGVTIAIDAAGTITATRVTGATGTINLTIVDVGTAAPTT